MADTTKDAQRIEVRGWIEEAVAQRCVLVELKSLIMDKRLSTFELAANVDADKLAGALVQACERHGKTQNAETIQYAALAWKTNPPAGSPDDYVTSLVVEVGGKGARKPGDTGTLEKNDLFGVVAQQMRLTDNLHRMLVAKMETGDAQWMRVIEKLEEKLERFEQRRDKDMVERLALVTLAEDLAKDTLTREQKRRTMALEEKRQEWVGDQLDQLIPILLNRLFGGGPGKGGAMTAPLLMKLLASLDETQMGQIMSSLSPSQTAMMSELYLSHEEEWKRLKGNRKHVTRDGEGGAEGAKGTNGAAAPAEGKGAS